LPKDTRIYFKRVIALAKTANSDDIEEFLNTLSEEG
jgi:hypothetical protein